MNRRTPQFELDRAQTSLIGAVSRLQRAEDALPADLRSVAHTKTGYTDDAGRRSARVHPKERTIGAAAERCRMSSTAARPADLYRRRYIRVDEPDSPTVAPGCASGREWREDRTEELACPAEILLKLQAALDALGRL